MLIHHNILVPTISKAKSDHDEAALDGEAVFRYYVDPQFAIVRAIFPRFLIMARERISVDVGCRGDG